MKIAKLLPLALATVIVAAPLRADEAAATPVPVATETAATNEAVAVPSTTETSRPLPEVRQGTPYMGSRKHLIGYSILFFVLSAVMVSVILRSKEDVPA